MFKQRLLLVAFVVLGVIALPVTVYLVQQQQSISQNASSTKNLTLSPTVQTVKVGDSVKYDIILHPNGIAVKYVNLVINYDSTKLSAKAGAFTKNPNFNLNPKGKEFKDGQIVLEFQTADLAKYINKEIIVGSITFRAIDVTDLASDVKFGNLKTIVKGADGKELSYQFNNASVTITKGTAVCPVDHATCSWSPVDGATNYNYKVTDKTTSSEVIKGVTTDTTISFDSITGHTYVCDVSAVNNCGSGTQGSDTATCISLTPTPTLSITPTETVTPTGTITITQTVTPTETLTPTESVTPTESLTPTPTLTITSTLTPTLTPTGKPTSTPTVTPTRVPTATPTTFIAISTLTPTTFVSTSTTVPGVVITATPTSVPAPLPPTGSNTFTLGAIMGTALVILGGLLLLVF